MDFIWYWLAGALVLQVIAIVTVLSGRNIVLFQHRDVVSAPGNAIVLKPSFSDFAFTAVILLIGATVGFGTTGWARFAIWGFFAACLWLSWRAYQHQIILGGDRMTVLGWRRFEVARDAITSYHIERDASEFDAVMWIEVRSGDRTCRLRKGLVGSRAQERAMLDFLTDR